MLSFVFDIYRHIQPPSHLCSQSLTFCNHLVLTMDTGTHSPSRDQWVQGPVHSHLLKSFVYFCVVSGQSANIPISFSPSISLPHHLFLFSEIIHFSSLSRLLYHGSPVCLHEPLPLGREGRLVRLVLHHGLVRLAVYFPHWCPLHHSAQEGGLNHLQDL